MKNALAPGLVFLCIAGGVIASLGGKSAVELGYVALLVWMWKDG